MLILLRRKTYWNRLNFKPYQINKSIGCGVLSQTLEHMKSDTEKLVFLYRMTPGVAVSSCAVETSRVAGFMENTLKRIVEITNGLKNNEPIEPLTKLRATGFAAMLEFEAFLLRKKSLARSMPLNFWMLFLFYLQSEYFAGELDALRPGDGWCASAVGSDAGDSSPQRDSPSFHAQVWKSIIQSS